VQLEDGTLRVHKKVDTRRADELHGLTRCADVFPGGAGVACAVCTDSAASKQRAAQPARWPGRQRSGVRFWAFLVDSCNSVRTAQQCASVACHQCLSGRDVWRYAPTLSGAAEPAHARRAIANNMIRGTSEGWSKTMQLIGVGYRAAVSGKTLTLNLGYSNPVVFDIPAGLSCSVRPALGELRAQRLSTLFPFSGPGILPAAFCLCLVRPPARPLLHLQHALQRPCLAVPSWHTRPISRLALWPRTGIGHLPAHHLPVPASLWKRCWTRSGRRARRWRS
jgi:hypothetical protein